MEVAKEMQIDAVEAAVSFLLDGVVPICMTYIEITVVAFRSVSKAAKQRFGRVAFRKWNGFFRWATKAFEEAMFGEALKPDIVLNVATIAKKAYNATVCIQIMLMPKVA